MKSQPSVPPSQPSAPLDWPSIRERAAGVPEEAFQFVREGLQHTAKMVHGEQAPPPVGTQPDERRHVSGRQLCMGLRSLALDRYGMLAKTVLGRWGIRRTEDFGVLVFAMIDRQELRQGERDSFDDFRGVFEFDEAFSAIRVN